MLNAGNNVFVGSFNGESTVPQDAYRGHFTDWKRDIMAYDLDAARTPTVLIIDDDEDQRVYFRALIKKLGCRVIAAESAAEAMNRLRSWPIDLIICDALMPVVGGLEFVEQVRKTKPYSDIPIIVTTALTKNIERSAIARGADMFCPKSRVSELLLQQIQYLLL